MKLGRRRARVPAETQHGQANGLAAELERLVAAPHVDVDLASLDRRARIEDRCRSRRSGCRASRSRRSSRAAGAPDPRRRCRPDGDAGGGRQPLAVRGRGERQPGARLRGRHDGRRAGGPAKRRFPRVEHRRLVERHEADRRNRRHDHLPPERPSDDHGALGIVEPMGRKSPGFRGLRSAISSAACGG